MNFKVIFLGIPFLIFVVLFFQLAFAAQEEAPVSGPAAELSVFGDLDSAKARHGSPLVILLAFEEEISEDTMHQVQLEVRDAAGKAQDWPFEKKQKSETKEIFWTLTPEQFFKITPGLYELTAAGPRISLEVLPAAKDLNPKQRQTVRRREIEFLEAQGKIQEAAQKISEWADQDPSTEVYAKQARLFESAGNKQEAFNSYNQAIHQHFKDYPNEVEPPLELFREQGRLFNELLAESKNNPVTIDPSKLKKWPDDFPEAGKEKESVGS